MTISYGRILCVDEDPKICEIVSSCLEDNGFTVYEANTVEDALDMFHKKEPDLVLCDLQMPKVDGVDLIEILTEKAPEMPVIMIVGNGMVNDLINALRLGAWDYLVKPILNLTVLEHTVCRNLERGRLVTENKRYRMELEEKNIKLSQSLVQLEEDQTAGKSIQQKMLPKEEVVFDNYTLRHKILPSLFLSGDFVDYFSINENKIGFYIADVSGHGASSAFVTVFLKNLVEQILVNYRFDRDDKILHPNEVLKVINDDLYHAKLGKYLTMVYGVIDVKENTLVYSIGGHYPSPILWDGQTAKFLEGKGFAVGIYEPAKFECYYSKLPPKFTIAMFSDGIFEVMRGGTLEKNEQHLLKIFDHTIDDVNEILYPLGLSSGRHFPDDITLLLLSYDEKMKNENRAR